MATLTRTNSRAGPAYKDYVNFLGGYKNGKKDNENSNIDNVPVKNFPLSTSSSNTSSSSVSLDVTDFAKNSCQSYNSFLENSRNKKFSSVKPNLDEKDEKTTMKSEIFIEIQPTRSVSEVSKMFEAKRERKSPARGQGINSKISIFEKQISTENKPKIAEKPVIKVTTPPPVKVASPPPKLVQENGFTVPPPAEFIIQQNGAQAPPPPPMPPINSTQKPPKTNENRVVPPPPPPVMNATQPKLQATLTKGPQTRYSVSNPNATMPNEIDRNNPLVRKLVYGTLRGLYGAYHDKASDMLATLPKNMVVKSNGVQDRIEQIAANGDLDKLNGRINPKLEQE